MADAHEIEQAVETTPMDHVDRFENLLDLTIRLAELTEVENLALAERRNDDVAAMLEDKAALSRLYENSMKAVVELDISWKEAMSDELTEKMRQAADRLTNAVAENTTRLEVGMRANKTVIDIVADAVKDNVPHAGTYSRNGSRGTEGAKASINSVAVALDQTL